jgi:hypothetical protein
MSGCGETVAAVAAHMSELVEWMKRVRLHVVSGVHITAFDVVQSDTTSA